MAEGVLARLLDHGHTFVEVAGRRRGVVEQLVVRLLGRVSRECIECSEKRDHVCAHALFARRCSGQRLPGNSLVLEA